MGKPSNYQHIIDLVKEVSGQNGIISVPRIFLKITDDLVVGLFLSQCVWWSDKGSRPDGSFWKSAREWKEEIGLSYAQVKRAEMALETLGLLHTELKRASGAPTTHYRIDMEKLGNLILEFLENRESRKSEKSKMDFEESLKSDFQETLKSLTAPTQALTPAPTPPPEKSGGGEGGGLPPKNATRDGGYLPAAEEQMGMLIPGAARIDEAHTEALTAIERSSWRIGGDAKDALVEFMVATHIGIPRPASVRKDWTDALTYHAHEYGASQLKTLYPAAVQYMRDLKLAYTRPASLTTALSKVAAEAKTAQPKQAFAMEWKSVNQF